MSRLRRLWLLVNDSYRLVARMELRRGLAVAKVRCQMRSKRRTQRFSFSVLQRRSRVPNVAE